MPTVNYFSNGVSVVAVELACSLISCVINGLALWFSPSPCFAILAFQGKVRLKWLHQCSVEIVGIEESEKFLSSEA